VIKSFRRDLHHPIGVVKRKRMAEREARSVVELARLVANGLDDLGVAMPGIDAPQAGDGIEHRPAFRRLVVHPLGLDKELRCRLEPPVRRHWHPVGFKVVRRNVEVRLGHFRYSSLV
jgi:hypothetical protein